MLVARRSSLAVLARLDAMLASPRGLSRREAAAELEVSTRTIGRYLDVIRDRLGADLEFDGRRWRHAGEPVFSGATRARAL